MFDSANYREFLEYIPSDLNVGVLLKVPQYRDLTEFHNWRRITLLLHVNQVLEPVMFNTLSYFLSPELVYEKFETLNSY